MNVAIRSTDQDLVQEALSRDAQPLVEARFLQSADLEPMMAKQRRHEIDPASAHGTVLVVVDVSGARRFYPAFRHF